MDIKSKVRKLIGSIRSHPLHLLHRFSSAVMQCLDRRIFHLCFLIIDTLVLEPFKLIDKKFSGLLILSHIAIHIDMARQNSLESSRPIMPNVRLISSCWMKPFN